MTFEYEAEIEPKFDFDHIELYHKVVETVLDEEKCPFEAWVSLLITDDEGIRCINRDSRNIDKATDVLSFPMAEYLSPADFEAVSEIGDNFEPDTGELLLGDIVLSYDHILAQAKEYEHSVRREFSFLIVHSMLHLIGYDHMTDEDRPVMEEKQRIIMEMLGISR